MQETKIKPKFSQDTYRKPIGSVYDLKPVIINDVLARRLLSDLFPRDSWDNVVVLVTPERAVGTFVSRINTCLKQGGKVFAPGNIAGTISTLLAVYSFKEIKEENREGFKTFQK